MDFGVPQHFMMECGNQRGALPTGSDVSAAKIIYHRYSAYFG